MKIIRKANGELAVLSKNEALKLLLLKGMELTDKPLDQFISKVLASRALARS